MKHVTISEYGTWVGICGQRLVVKREGELLLELPLSRLKTVTISKNGVALSSNVLLEFSARGIKLFVLDKYASNMACLSGGTLHAVCRVRERQFAFSQSHEARLLCQKLIASKLKNQRVILLYFSKYLKKRGEEEQRQQLYQYSDKIKSTAHGLKSIDVCAIDDWRSAVLGYEGAGAAMYWQGLQAANIFPASFTRQGRGATDTINGALNYGYAILAGYVWHCLLNAGLEIYQGMLHTSRPGKPALVLDVMEEYRAWVVDRNIIKLGRKLADKECLSAVLRREIAAMIHKTMATFYPYKGKRAMLETIMQRQIYRLSGHFSGQQSFKPFIFKW
jgi:CRISPR-associated protein Cas1